MFVVLHDKYQIHLLKDTDLGKKILEFSFHKCHFHLKQLSSKFIIIAANRFKFLQQ